MSFHEMSMSKPSTSVPVLFSSVFSLHSWRSDFFLVSPVSCGCFWAKVGLVLGLVE